MSDKPLYNSQILLTFINLLKDRYPQVNPDLVLAHAGINSYEVCDGGQWFTQQEVDLFIEKLVELTGNSDIAREGGRYAASLQASGAIRKHLLCLLGPANAFFAISGKASSLTRSSSYQSRRISSNKVEITVTPAPESHERPYQCQNRLGFFDAMLTVFNYDLPEIEHPACLFNGDPCCRYIVSWKKRPPALVREARNLLGVLLLCGGAALSFSYPWQSLAVGVPLLATTLLAGTALALCLEKKELHAALADLKESTDELLEQTKLNYNNALMVNEMGQAISKQTDEDEVLQNIIRAVETRLGYDRGVILLADPDGARLRYRIGFGYTEEQLGVLKQTSFSLTNPDSKGVFVTCFREQRPILVNDFARIAGQHSAGSVKLAELLGARSFICCAIVCEGASLGIMAVDNIRSKKALVASDMRLLAGVAPVIGMSIRNAAYIELERRRLEQMRQSQKMEAIGELAGGVAHDFNNLLTAIIGFATLAQLSTERESQSYPYLEEVLIASQRAAHVTQGLLAFSRRHAFNPQPADLNGIAAQMEKLLRRLISEEIDLRFALWPEPLVVRTDSSQIDQILLNLVTNARDAMENRGTLTIETAREEVDPSFLERTGQGRTGSHARLVVRDTGKGIDPETRAHMFDPFFTTKEKGSGTGLGLSIVHGIVKQHGGFMDVRSAPGSGTSFAVYLPLLQQDASPLRHPGAGEPLLTGSGTILVVEDSPEVRKMTCEVLQQHGYRVIEAVDGQDGLEKFLLHKEEIRLVIMDVVLPRMNGKEAFAALAGINPDLKVLFTSGYTPEEVSRKGVRFGRDNFIAKPASPATLLKMVQEQLSTM